jgi:hypothetical protein
MRLNLRLDVAHEQKGIMVSLVAAQLSEAKPVVAYMGVQKVQVLQGITAMLGSMEKLQQKRKNLELRLDRQLRRAGNFVRSLVNNISISNYIENQIDLASVK